MEQIKIEKFKNRFTLKSKYDAELLDIIHKKEQRYWASDKLEWSFPLTAYDSLISEIQNLNKYQIVLIDHKPVAYITKDNDSYELKFATYVDNFMQFKHLTNAQYNKDTRRLTIPANEYDSMIKLLKENEINYTLMDEEKQEEKHEEKTEEEKKPKAKRSILKKAQV